VTTDLQFTGPQVMVNIDRDKAGSLGVSAEQIQNTLYDAFGTRQISTIFTNIDSYEVIMELSPEYQNDISALSKLYVRSSTNNKLIPLTAVATITQGSGPLSINHQTQLPAVTISFGLKPGISLGQAVDTITQLQQTLN